MRWHREPPEEKQVVLCAFLKTNSVPSERGLWPEKSFRADRFHYRLLIRCLKANGKEYRHE
jgi:hypothetical protein